MSQIPIPGGTASGLQSHGPIFGDSMSGTIPPPPELVDVPAITVNGAMSASAVPGDVLECTLGNWLLVPTAYDARWKRDGTENIGDGSPLYTATEADVGHSITCTVAARNAYGETIAPPSNSVSITAAGGMTRGASPPAHRR